MIVGIQGELKIIGTPKIAILASRFNQEVVENLIEGAIEGLTRNGFPLESVDLYRIPGAFELPWLAQRVIARYDGCIALGAVIRGETPHFDYVASECARGLAQVGLTSNKPIIFGVLTTDTDEQALARADKKMENNKGFDAALNLIEMLNLISKIKNL